MSDAFDPIDCNSPGSSVLGFSKQEYWSGLPSPPPGDLPNPGIKLTSLALKVDSLPLSHLGNPAENLTSPKTTGPLPPTSRR